MPQQRSLEGRVFRAEFESGLLEVFVGVAVGLIGLGWLADMFVMSAVIPAAIISMWGPVRRRLIAPRAGAVRYRQDRRRKIRRGQLALLALGLVSLLGGIGLFLAEIRVPGDIVTGPIVAGFPAGILAMGAVVAAAVFDIHRLRSHALVLAVGAVWVVIVDGHPGWSMLGAGAVILLAGMGLFVGFLRHNPVVEEQE